MLSLHLQCHSSLSSTFLAVNRCFAQFGGQLLVDEFDTPLIDTKRNMDKRITLAASITSIVVFKGPVPLRMNSQIQLRMAI